MAEINAAYAALTRRGDRRHTRAATAGNGAAGGAAPGTARRTGGPPPTPKPPGHRPRRRGNVAAQPDDNAARLAQPLTGQPPLRPGRSERDLRASQPTGPLENWRDPATSAIAPPLDDALVREVEFGKFHGHTLGEIAAFEPSYIDWLAGTVTRDPELALAARVIRDELDRRGIIRTTGRRPGWHSNPFR